MSTMLLEQKPLVEKYLKASPKVLSAFSFINMFSWQEYFQFREKIINGCLCIFASNELGTFLYLPPLGAKITEKMIEICFAIMKEVNGTEGVSRIENVCATQLHLFAPDKFSFYRKDYECCYYRRDIVELKGNDYKSKRSSYNQFVHGYRYQYLPYQEDMFKECLSLYEAWAQGRRHTNGDEIYLNMLDENLNVHKSVLQHYKELGLTGRVVCIDGKIKSYTFGYSLNENIFCVLFEIADCNIKGLPVFTFRKFCSDEALESFKFINVMDSFGMRNVEKTKMSYRPSILFSSYAVTERQEEPR